MAGSTKGLVLSIGGDTSELQKALKNVNTVTSSLQKELKSVNNLLKFDSSNVSMNAQKTKLLKSEIQATEEKLKDLKNAQKLADEAIANGTEISQKDYRALEREIEATKTQLANLKTEASKFTKAAKALNEFGTSLENVGNTVSSIGNKLTTGITVPIVSVGALAVKSASEFESAWTGVTKTVDGTDEQLSNLRQGIIDLSEEIPSSASEIANVAEIAGQLGIATDNVLDFTKVMIDMGNSTNLSAEDAASALAKFANVTNMSAEDYSKLGSVIVDLGNNFATTESDIVDMATRLASTGELTGLSQSQIMALATAISSVGIESEAGGSAMSKLLKKIQVATETGGESLEEFAKVSGMSAEEFKKAYAEDATSALTAFLSGLQDTERNGKSAIAVLNDMGLNETRLSNTILALSSNSELLSSAFSTANKAWNDNNALTTEANKRYATFESQLEIVKNKAQNLGASIGEKLMPYIEKLLDKVSSVVEWFGSLSDEEQNSILKAVALAAAIGPVVSVLGKVTSAAGTAFKKMSELSSAIVKISSSAALTNAAIGGIVTVIGVALVAAIGSAVKAYQDMRAEQVQWAKDQQAEIDALNETTRSRIESVESMKESSKTSMEANLDELNYTEQLKNELTELVDANGKVKEGYEDRANYILNELKDATGIEYELVDGEIQDYDDLMAKMDDYMLKKKAEIVMKTKEEDYENAIKNQSAAYQDLADKQEKLADVESQLTQKQKELKDAQDASTDFVNGGIVGVIEARKEVSTLTDEIGILQQSQSDLQSGISESQKEVSGYVDTIADYEKNQELYLEGSEESLQTITDSVGRLSVDISKASEEGWQNSIKAQQNALNTSKQLYDAAVEAKDKENQDKYAKDQEYYKKNIEALAENLGKQAETVTSLSEDEALAWQQLATKSTDAYNAEISKLPTKTQEMIQNAVDDVSTWESDNMASAYNGMGSKSLSAYLQNDFTQAGKTSVFNLASGIDAGKSTAKTSADGVANAVTSELDSMAGSASSATDNMLSGIDNKLNSKDWHTRLTTSSGAVAGLITNAIKKTWDIHSPSKVTAKLTDFYLQPMYTGFSDAQKDLGNKAAKMASNINSSVMEGFSVNGMQSKLDGLTSAYKQYNVNMTIQPQTLSNAELNNAFNFVNRKLGLKGA